MKKKQHKNTIFWGGKIIMCPFLTKYCTTLLMELLHIQHSHHNLNVILGQHCERTQGSACALSTDAKVVTCSIIFAEK